MQASLRVCVLRRSNLMSESVVIRFTHFSYYFKLKIKKTELKLHKQDKECKLTIHMSLN